MGAATVCTRLTMDMKFQLHIHIHICRSYVDIHGSISCRPICASTEYPQSTVVFYHYMILTKYRVSKCIKYVL